VVEGEALEGEALEGEALEGEASEGEALEGEASEGEVLEGEALEGEASGAESDPNVHWPWSTPTPVSPPVKVLKKSSVRSRPFAPQPMHCEKG
jgi:hypothetical protein